MWQVLLFRGFPFMARYASAKSLETIHYPPFFTPQSIAKTANQRKSRKIFQEKRKRKKRNDSARTPCSNSHKT